MTAQHTTPHDTVRVGGGILLWVLACLSIFCMGLLGHSPAGHAVLMAAVVTVCVRIRV